MATLDAVDGGPGSFPFMRRGNERSDLKSSLVVILLDKLYSLS
jgi:hypothetical protein